jgi:hypothetical protein
MRATWMKWTAAAVAAIGMSGQAALLSAEGDKKSEKKSEKSAVKADAKSDKSAAKADKPKGPEHVAYADALWKYVTRASSPYSKWTAVEKSPEILVGPQPSAGSKVFVNKDAATNLKNPPHRSMIVIEHYATDAKTKKPALSGVTVKFRPKAGYDARHEDWYWAYYLPGGKHVECSVVTKPLAKAGFITFEENGRLWVFRAGSKELADYVKNGELAAHVSLPGIGPGGMTVRGPDKETIVDYVLARPGFATKIVKEQLWVFRAGGKDWKEFLEHGEPAKQVTRPLAGPMGMTIRSSDSETIEEYLNAKAGFVTIVEDGRLWVFRPGSKELAEYRKAGELAKQVVQPGAGPDGVTIKAPDKETIVEYLTARDGFTTVYDKDRLWVFRSGSDPLWKFKKDGELAQHVVRPAAGPMGLTVKAPDGETLDWYLRLAAE